MATKVTLPPKVQRNPKGFATLLKAAACEWLLICLLFIDAALSYLLTRFAHYCELQIPCILCSRLDHVFGNKKPGFYWNLICSSHRSEIHSLVSCNIHGKLVNGCGMSENRLSSHIEDNESNSDRLFLGKLGFDPLKCNKLCLCCDKPCLPISNAPRLLPLKSPSIAVEKPNISLPRRLGRRNGLKKVKGEFSAPEATHLLGETGFDPLSHVGYAELKITSESESEVPFSDDEDGNSIVCDTKKNKKECIVHSAPETPSRRLHNNLITTKQPNANEPRDFIRCPDPKVSSENDVCEHKEQLADQKTNPSGLPELISLDDIPPSSRVVEVPSFSASLLSDLISLVDTPPLIDVMEVPLEASSEKLADNIEASKNEKDSINKKDQILKLINTSSGADFKIDRVVDDTAMVNSTDDHPTAVHKSPVCGEEKVTSMFATEEPRLTCDNEVNEDLKSLPMQNSSVQGIDLSLNNLSPKLRGHGVEFPRIFESNSDQNLQKLGFMEKIGSAGLESLGGNSVDEIEGENLVNRLKRQVEYDQKCLNALYKELEEERSASAIAANQAMAMITKLQEEKSSLHMEALQYLRMMEEQAEYDVDALEKANDLLAEKEKEIQDLEAELEFYRLNFTDETMIETIPEPEAITNLYDNYVSAENTITSFKKDDSESPSKTTFPETSELIDNPAVISGWSEIEDEKTYISECLQNLERKLSRYSHQGTSPCISDGEYCDETSDGGQHQQQEFLDEKDKQAACNVEGNNLQLQSASSVSNGSAAQEWSGSSISKDELAVKENGHMVSNQHKGSENSQETGLAGLEHEISDLNERLESLEADCSFLEHSLNSLHNGSEGLVFIQEIIHRLRELRKLGIKNRRNMFVS